MIPSRLCCTVCVESDEIYRTIDLCKDCVSKEVHRKESDGLEERHHDASHTLIQLRRPLLVSQLNSVIAAGRTVLEYADGPTECHSCKKELSEKPYWYCLRCYPGKTLFPRSDLDWLLIVR